MIDEIQGRISSGSYAEVFVAHFPDVFSWSIFIGAELCSRLGAVSWSVTTTSASTTASTPNAKTNTRQQIS